MKIFDWQANKGIIDSVSGQPLTNSGVVFKDSNKGIVSYHGSTNSIRMTMPAPITLSRLSSSIAVGFYSGNVVGDRYIIGHDSTTFKYLGTTSTNFYLKSNTNNDNWLLIPTSNIIPNKWYFLVVSADNGIVKSYLNGLLVDTRTVTNDVTFSVIGNSTINGFNFIGNLSGVTLYNNPTLVTQANTLYKQFLQLQPIQSPKRNFEYQKPLFLRETGLVGAWNMKLINNKVYDISGNNRDGTIVGSVTPTKYGLSFNGGIVNMGDVINFPNNFFSISVEFTSYNTSIRNTILSKAVSAGTHLYYIDVLVGGKLRVLAGQNSSNYVFRDTVSTIIVGKKNTFTYTWDGNNVSLYLNGVLDQGTQTQSGVKPTTLVSTDPLKLGGASFTGSTNFKGELSDARLYDKALSLQQIKNYHNQFARRIILKENFSSDKADGNVVVPRGCIAGTGTYKLVTETTGNSIIKKGTNYLQCVTAGTVKYPIRLSGNESGSIKYFDGTSWSTKTGTMTSIVGANPWITITGGFLTLNTTAGKRFADLIVKEGIEV